MLNSSFFPLIVPQQVTGTEFHATATVTVPSGTDAAAVYQSARQKLLDVNHWHELAGIFSATFQLVDAAGNPVDRMVCQGDYFRIDVPGPGSSAGHGYDWVLVEALQETSNDAQRYVGLRVRPSGVPGDMQNRIAHFYSTSATSTFILHQNERELTAHIFDRNLLPNNQPASMIDRIRDTSIGLGAIAGLSNAQWKALVRGLVTT